MLTDGSTLCASVNDTLRDMAESLDDEGVKDVRVVTYGDNAKLFWKSGKTPYTDMELPSQGDRSNLGAAYELVKATIDGEGIAVGDCAIMLLSDGEATDDYKKQLSKLDPDDRAFRLSVALGNKRATIEKHACNDSLVFDDITSDYDEIISTIADFNSR